MTDARLPQLDPADLTPDQRAVYDAITGGRRALGPRLFDLVDERGRLNGPFNAFLLQPRLGMALQDLGAAIRFDTSLTDRCREIAILVVATHWDSAFEWYAHEAIGRHAGLTDDELAAIRDSRPDAFHGREAVVFATCHALVCRGDLTDEEYAGALESLGAAGLFEVLTLVGHYAMLALQLRVFRVGRADLGGRGAGR